VIMYFTCVGKFMCVYTAVANSLEHDLLDYCLINSFSANCNFLNSQVIKFISFRLFQSKCEI